MKLAPGNLAMAPTGADRSPTQRLAIVLSHPIQYYSPWFRWLRANTRLPFRVFYLWESGVAATRDVQFGATFAWDVDLLSGYDHEFVPNVARDPGMHHFWGINNPLLPARLAAWRPTALLLFGYKWASNLRAVAWARRRGVPLVFRGDSHLLGHPAPSLVKRLALRALFARFAAFLCVGAANRDYFRAFGVPETRLHFAPHAVDRTLFDATRAVHRTGAAALRASLGLAPETRVVLFAGKFVTAKQPRELLRAFLELQLAGAALVFVGDGEQKPELLALAKTAPAAAVHFLPFANQSEMPARYAAADIFALPSRGLYETWGLAVNEAMEMGVPPLVSDRVGCQRDLVTPGETGWVFAAEDYADLKATLARALQAVALDRAGYRARVHARISAYSYAAAAAGLFEALAALPSAA